MQELLALTDSDKLKELSLKNSGLLEQHDPNLAMFGNMPKRGDCCTYIFFITI